MQQATVTEIAEELEVHKSTASRLLTVLEQHRLVIHSDIAFEGLIWKTKPGAWEEEPPVRYSGP